MTLFSVARRQTIISATDWREMAKNAWKAHQTPPNSSRYWLIWQCGMFGVDVRSIWATSDWKLSDFCLRVGIFADMWIEWEDLRPIAAVLYHLFSVLIYVGNLPKSFVGLLQFFCARGSRECSWRSMVKNIFWKWGFMVMRIDWAKRYIIADLAHGLNDKKWYRYM